MALYRTVIEFIFKNANNEEEEQRVDSLQQIHTITNLLEILKQNSDMKFSMRCE